MDNEQTEQNGSAQACPVEIRVASYADADAIIQLRTGASREHFNFIQGCITARRCYAALTKDRPVGYAIMDESFFGHAFISHLLVHPDYRRQGIGYRLLRYLEKQADSEKLFISCEQSNQPVQKLFEKLGFAPSGRIEHLNEHDAELIFYKKLP